MPVAIVTGSDSGIGRATAVALANTGHDVGVTWRSDDEAAAATAEEVRSHGVRAAVRRLDLADPDAAVAAALALADELGGCHVLVDNAGGGGFGPVLEGRVEDLAQTVHDNVVGTFAVTQAIAERMVAGDVRGRIVTVPRSTSASRCPRPPTTPPPSTPSAA